MIRSQNASVFLQVRVFAVLIEMIRSQNAMDEAGQSRHRSCRMMRRWQATGADMFLSVSGRIFPERLRLIKATPMAFSRALPALLLLTAMAAGGGRVALAKDTSGAFDFIIQEQQKAQPAQPVRPADTGPVVPRDVGPSGPAAVSVPQSRTYCVRTCDGYYFAVGFARNQAQVGDQRAMCAASCGEAPMKLYTATLDNAGSNGSSSPAIEHAIDDSGSLYTALPTAYAFRTAENPACSCKSTANGLPQIPISIDPTLRPGDIVVMADGLKVFRGNAVGPHKDTDFISVASSKALPTIIRQQMLSLQERIAPQ